MLISISLFSQITLTTSYTEPSCVDGNDGSLTVTPSGGVAPYTYEWTGFGVNATTQTVNNLYADIYDLTVTDANNTTATATVSLPNPTPLVNIINMDLFDPDPCDTMMCVEAFVDDDTYISNVNWTPNTGFQGPGGPFNTSYSLCFVQPNTGYTVEITDQNGCLHTSSYQTPGFGFFDVDVTSTDATCATGGTATATAQFAGNPTFLWSNGATTPTISGLVSGTYFVTVTTSFGNCVKIDTAVIGNNGTFNVAITSNIDPCTGETCLVTNAPANSSFVWSNTSTTSQLCTTAPGTYTVTVTSPFGCTATSSATVNAVPLLSITMSATSASCGNDGTVSVIAQNGAAPYTYFWNTTEQTATLTNKPAGNYTVTVTDANGCVQVDSIDITNGNFQIDSIGVEGATCNTSSDGSAYIQVSGSNPPFSYAWSNADTNALATGLSEGVYTVTVTDVGGCFLVQTITVPTVGLQVDVEILVYSDCISHQNGVLGAQVTNGSAPYTYQWGNGSTTATAASLATGGHNLTVTDANGCSNIGHYQIEPDPNCFADLRGNVYVDMDSSCSITATDIGVRGATVSIDPGYTAITNANGDWHARVLTGYTYNVHLNNNLYFTLADACGIDTIPVAVPDSNDVLGLDLPKKTTQIVDASISINCGIVRPGFSIYISTTVMNNSFTDMNISGSITLDSIYTTVSLPQTNPYFTIDSVSSGIPRTIYFTCNNVLPQTQVVIPLFVQVPTLPTVALGQAVTNSAVITVDGLVDADLTNNQVSCLSQVTGAYDPNDKQVFSEGENVDGIATPEDTLLHYLVRFQNTGTDTAFNVVIRDTLDEGLDATSFRYLASSHDVDIEFHEERIVHFVFNNILLPDSNVNESASHGFVEFEIKVDHPEMLEPIENMAAIYFDFNPPIFTNTVSTERQLIESVNEVVTAVPVHVFPNPTTGALAVNLGGNPVDRVEVYNMMGKQLLQQYFDSTHQADIDVRDLPNGMYLVRIQSGTTWYTNRVLVSK